MPGWILWLVFGALVGWIASIVMARNSSMGLVANIIVGIVGAFLGGLLFNRGVAPNVLSLSSVLTALLGAVVLLAIVNLVTRKRLR